VQRVRLSKPDITDAQLDAYWRDTYRLTFWSEVVLPQCLAECAKASWWERTWGECRTG